MGRGLYLHADVPCAPDSGTQVADGDTVADAVDVLALAADRCGNEADAVYDVVVLDLKYVLAVLGSDNDGLVLDLADGMLKVGGNLVILENITQEGSVGQADVLCGNEVLCVLDDDRVLALENHLVCSLASGLAAAEEHDFVAYGVLLTQQLSEGKALLEAGDQHLSGNCAGCNDDLVIAAEDAQVVDLGVEANVETGLLNFILIPLDESLVVLLEAHCGSSEEQAADAVGLLEDDGLVAALEQNQACLYAADTGADDGNLLGVLGGNDLVAVVLHGRRSKCAAAEVQGVLKALNVCGALVLSKVEAAVVAADAGLDLVLAAFLDLDDPIGVDEVLTCDCDSVETAGGDLLRSGLGQHTACACYGLIGELLYVLNVCEVAVVGHVLRRMCPVPGVVSTVIAVEEVVAHVAEVLDGLLGFGHVTAPLLELLAGNSALAPALGVGLDGVTQGYGEVFTGISLDALYDLDGEAETVLEGAAVLVFTPVPVLHGELVKQVTFVNSVDLNAVDACVAQHLCGLAECLDHLADLLDGHGAGEHILLPTVRSCGCGSAAVAYVDDGGSDLVEDGILVQDDHPGGNCHRAAEACCQLDEQLGAGLVVLYHVLFELLEHSLVLVQPAAAHGITDTLHAGENKANALLCSLEQEISCLFVEMAGLKPAKQRGAAHGTLDNAVFNLDIADLERSK